MSDTCIRAHFHMVYAVKYRAALIAPAWQGRLHQYSIGLIEEHGHDVLALNSMPDHLHVLLRYNINETIPHLMQHLKRDTSRWINAQGFVRGKFAWQVGYGGFVVEPFRIDTVVKYIRNQEEHHRKKTMRQEIKLLVEREGIPYDPRYGFQEPE
ncbi:IS200/IS605 family transposase [Flaviaesturariibacter aridisoli]|uniref:IS200/IS605 family transposase n=1 Tax=Flaviaesturariibacter aridisoli TaxID=2545761 RepID=A0A4R4DWK0_9BACT|nr:IS200/IS605 family transposase [Flaviaesturariibacter aridisoli]TCZ67066.1 IS200/IS605 family transposase [Flaviaesturariibacter aridisoli]